MTASTTTTSTTATDAAPPRRGYGALWAKVPREFGFLILTMPIAIIGLVVLATVFFTGLGLVTIFVGSSSMVAALYIARGFGTLELDPPAVGRPPRDRRAGVGPRRPRAGLLAIDARAVHRRPLLAVPAAHGMINPIVSIVTWSITIAWTSVALAGTTGWIWQPFIPTATATFWLNEWLVDRFVPGNDFAYDPVVGERIFEVLLGLVFLATLPFVFRGLTLAPRRDRPGHARRLALRGPRGRGRGSSPPPAAPPCRPRTRRSAASSATSTTDRSSGSCACRWISRPSSAGSSTTRSRREGARSARRATRPGRRSTSCGPCPAGSPRRSCRTAASPPASSRSPSRSPVPVIVEIDLADAALPAPSRAQRVLHRRRAAHERRQARRAPPASACGVATRDEGVAGRWLDVWVADNGRGGAAPTPGHGLAGLDERVRGLRGMLVIDSPAGGPTTVGAHVPYVPLAASAPHRPRARRGLTHATDGPDARPRRGRRRARRSAPIG